MRHKRIQHSIDSRFDRLHKALTRAVAHFAPEDIHAFRVEVKKLRAFLTLLAAEDPSKTILTGAGRARLPRRLRRFYRMTGEIRNLQLQQQRIKEYWKEGEDALPRAYCNLLETELAARTLVAGDFAARKLAVKSVQQQILKRTPDHIRKRSVEKFLRKKKYALGVLLKTPQPWEDTLFHSIRKLLKDLLYIIPDLSPGLLLRGPFINLLPGAAPGSLPAAGATVPPTRNAGILPTAAASRFIPATPEPTEKRIRILTETLGTFQDSCIALAQLDDPYLRNIPDEIKKTGLVELKNEWQEEKARTKTGIYLQLAGAVPARSP